MISTGLAIRLRQTAVLLVAVGGSWMAPAATAADQTVDQVEVFSFTKLLRLKFDVTPTQLVGLTAAPTSNLRACQSSANSGLICLDGQVVRQWPSTIEHPIAPGPITPAAGTALFSCSDTAFTFKAGNPCTTMTVDTKGGIWVAGQKPTNLYSLMQVVKKDAGGLCPAAAPATPTFTSLNQSTGYCFRERAAGRPKITDLSPVEGGLVEQYFTEGEGVLGVEGVTTVAYYPFDFTQNLRTFGSWPASVQSAAIFQRVESTVLQTYVVVTVNSGLVYSRVITAGDDETESPFVHANSDTDPLKLPRGAACAGGVVANQFRVRASETSGRVFITNRNYCRAYVVTPGPLMSGIALPYDALATTSPSGNYPPDGLSVAPGIAVNVA
ncbi:MAG: hypothetical protein NT025_00090, partial [bacterium]|nr:hypothetical protein [bacterium]